MRGCTRMSRKRIFVFLGQRQVACSRPVIFDSAPGLDRDLAVGFRSQGEDHLGGVDGAVDTRPAWLTPLSTTRWLRSPTSFTSFSVFKPMPLLPPLPSLSSSGPSEVNLR